MPVKKNIKRLYSNNPFMNLLTHYKINNNLMLKEMAIECEINEPTLNRYFSGESIPGVLLFSKICDGLNIDDDKKLKLLKDLSNYYIDEGVK